MGLASFDPLIDQIIYKGKGRKFPLAEPWSGIKSVHS